MKSLPTFDDEVLAKADVKNSVVSGGEHLIHISEAHKIIQLVSREGLKILGIEAVRLDTSGGIHPDIGLIYDSENYDHDEDDQEFSLNAIESFVDRIQSSDDMYLIFTFETPRIAQIPGTQY